jgi:hypothetical protein
VDFTRYIWELYATSDCGRAAIAKPADSYAAAAFGSDPFLLSLRVFRRGPDDDPSPIEGEFVEISLREEIQACLSGEVNDAATARSLFETFVDEGLEISLEDDGEELCFLGGQGFEEEVFSNIEAFSLTLYVSFPQFFVPFLFRSVARQDFLRRNQPLFSN